MILEIRPEPAERAESRVRESKLCDSRLRDSRLCERSVVPWGQRSTAQWGQKSVVPWRQTPMGLAGRNGDEDRCEPKEHDRERGRRAAFVHTGTHGHRL